MRRAVLPAFLLLVFCSLQASATSFSFSPTAATFTRQGDVNFGSPGGGTLDFTLSLNNLSASTFNLLNAGDVVLVRLGSMTLAETTIDCSGTGSSNECENLGLVINFTLQGLLPFNLTAASFTAVGGSTSDANADASVSFQSISQTRAFGSTGVIEAKIVGGDNAATATNPINWNSDCDTETMWAKFTLVQPDGGNVPEPGTALQMGGGLALAALLGRRFRKA